MAPIDLNIRTNVIPQVISAFVFPKVSARLLTVKETVKKSKASQVQAIKATRKKSHCCVLRRRNVLNGFGIGLIGGRNDENRVEMYLPVDICSSSEFLELE